MRQDVIEKLKYTSIFITAGADHVLYHPRPEDVPLLYQDQVPVKNMVYQNARVLSVLDPFWLPRQQAGRQCAA